RLCRYCPLRRFPEAAHAVCTAVDRAAGYTAGSMMAGAREPPVQPGFKTSSQGQSMLRKSSLVAGAAAASALVAAPAHAGWSSLNMPKGVTTLSDDIYGLHMLILGIVALIGVFVFAWMIYSLVKFRKSQGAVPDTQLVHSTKDEIIWTAIPVAILVGMAVPAARTLIDIEDTSATDINIKVTGYQWKWHYEYLDEGFGFFSTLARDSDAARQRDSGVDPRNVPDYLLNVDNPLVVPVGKKVRLLITS